MYTKAELRLLKRKQAQSRAAIREATKAYTLEGLRTLTPERPLVLEVGGAEVKAHCQKCGAIVRLDELAPLVVADPVKKVAFTLDARPKSPLGARLGDPQWKRVVFPQTEKFAAACPTCRGVALRGTVQTLADGTLRTQSGLRLRRKP